MKSKLACLLLMPLQFTPTRLNLFLILNFPLFPLLTFLFPPFICPLTSRSTGPDTGSSALKKGTLLQPPGPGTWGWPRLGTWDHWDQSHHLAWPGLHQPDHAQQLCHPPYLDACTDRLFPYMTLVSSICRSCSFCA